MTSIDDLFKSRAASSAGTKRKLDASHNPADYYKSARTTRNGDAKGQQHASAEDAPPSDDDAEEEAAAGPAPDTAEQGEDDEDEDEEGRFFGGGMTRNTAAALDYMEGTSDDGADSAGKAPERVDAAWVRRTATALERRVARNAEQRAKHMDEPARFMASEGELDAAVKALSLIAEHPGLYGEFAEAGAAGALVRLVGHENTDIAINAIEILAELTDEDVQAEPGQWDALTEALFEADLPGLLVENLARLDEAGNEADRSGVYHSLSLLENLVSQTGTLDKTIATSHVLPWLLARIKRAEKRTTQNKQYAAEVLAIALQSSPKARAAFLASADGLDTILQALARYRKHDPAKDYEDEEFVENLFDALTCLADTDAGKRHFRAAEGPELMLIMLRDGGKLAKARALRVLDHALARAPAAERDTSSAQPEHLTTCEALVDAAGLKPLFGALMRAPDAEAAEHALGALASLLRTLPGDSAARIRTLAKCVEKGYQVVRRLVGLRRECAARLARVQAGIDAERAELGRDSDEAAARADEWLSRRLDAGLFTVQTVDVVLAWLAAEDAGARAELEVRLAEGGRDEGLADVRATLVEQLDGLKGATDPDEVETADMLRTLSECLQ